jgi:membrane-bound ClpP family serine protease
METQRFAARRRSAARRAGYTAGLLVLIATTLSTTAESSDIEAVPAYRQANNVAVLTIDGVVDAMTLRSIERRLALAQANGADAIVLDIDTPGGELTATLDICNLLKDRSLTPANTVAWIHPQAYSAGTIIALACREIVVSPNAAFGDAAPISPFGPIPQTERAKLESPILSEVVDSARRNRYDEKLVQGFVSVGVELWLLQNIKTGERIVVDRPEYVTVFGQEPPDLQTPVASPESGQTVKPWYDRLMRDALPQPSPEDQGMTEQEVQDEIAYQQVRPSSRRALSEADKGQWELVAQVVSEDRLLTVRPGEAVYYGLATAVIANDNQLKQYFGATTLTRYDRSWSESLVRILISWPVRIVLIIIFLVSLFIELAAPGLGVFGAAAAAALLVLIGAPYLAGMAQWWEIVLVAAGLLLIAAELFLIPGIGVAGVAGVLCVFIGLVGTFITGDIGQPQGRSELWTGLLTVLVAVFVGGVLIWFLSRQMHSISILNRVILKAELSDSTLGSKRPPGLLESIG